MVMPWEYFDNFSRLNKKKPGSGLTPILLKETPSFICFVYWGSLHNSIIVKEHRKERNKGKKKTSIVEIVAPNISVVKTFQNAIFNVSILKTEHKSV